MSLGRIRARFNNVTFLTLLTSATLARPLKATLAPCPGETFNQKKQKNQNGNKRTDRQPGKCDRKRHKKNCLDVEDQKNAVKKLFDDIAPKSAERNGGYTRIVKLGQRMSDSAPMAFIEWVDMAEVIETKAQQEKKAKQKKAEPKAKRPEPEQPEPERAEAIEEEPAAREEKPSEQEEKPAEAPVTAEEPKPKKRRWFGRKSSE